MSRKKLKNRRRKDRAQRKILIAAVCIAAVIIGVGIGGHVIKKNAGKTMTTAETESKKAVSKKKATAKKLTINENETDASNKENQGQKDQADDRSEFAVQPGRKVGTTEQSDEKVVYLTLDDGPSKNTQAVLDILDKYNAKATFFVTGAMPEYKDMIKKAYDKGHTIGMHTYSHDYAKVYASVDAYFQDLDHWTACKRRDRLCSVFYQISGRIFEYHICKLHEGNYDNAYAGGSGKRISIL